MKKRNLFLITLVVLLIFIIGCTEQISEEELKSELDNLSEEELTYILSDDEEAIVGAAQFDRSKLSSLRSLKRQIKPYIITCSDSDGGNNYQEAGFVTLFNYPGGPIKKSDKCWTDGKRLQEYVCENNKYKGDHTFNCSNLGENYVCEEGACVEKIYSLSDYENLLAHNKIGIALGTLSDTEEILLWEKLTELEQNDISTWDEYGDLSYEFLTYAQIREIWLQRVAFSLYHEIHNTFPWSIQDYSQEDINSLLSYCHLETQNFDLYNYTNLCSQNFRIEPEGYTIISLWVHNPFDPYNYGQEVLSGAGYESIPSQREFLEQVILDMRNKGWRHWLRAIDGEFEDYPHHGERGAFNFNTAKELCLGTSSLTSEFVGSIMRSWNIPPQYIFFGHPFVIFPTIDVGMDGDGGVYGFYQKNIPVQYAYHDKELLYEWFNQPHCQGSSEKARNLTLTWLPFYDDPLWNYSIVNEYCIWGNDSFRTNHLEGEYQQPVACRDPRIEFPGLSEEEYQRREEISQHWRTPLTEEEINEWLNRLEEHIDCNQ